jgi:hypothetical protein
MTNDVGQLFRTDETTIPTATDRAVYWNTCCLG